MAVSILDGTAVAGKIKESLKPAIKELQDKGLPLKVQAIQVGEDPSSSLYVRQQAKAFQEIGIPYEIKQLGLASTVDQVVAALGESNADAQVTGIILQTPLPSQLPQNILQSLILPLKDVEGVHPANMGSIVYGTQICAPCTALAALTLILETGVPLKGKEAVIIGRSEIVGMPLAMLMLRSLPSSNSPTVTVCHSGTANLADHIRRADILVAAVGRPRMVSGDLVKRGSVVIDVGTNRIAVVDKDGKPVMNEQGKPKMMTVGDVDFEKAKERCGFISPVPGGVGPVTVAILLKKAVEYASLNAKPQEK